MKTSQQKKSKILGTLVKYSFIFATAFILVAPVLAKDPVFCTSRNPDFPPGCIPLAGGDSNTPAGGDSNTPSGADSNTGLTIHTRIKNPLAESGIDNIPALIEKIIYFVLLIAIPIITLAIIYSGFLFVTAGGNSEKLKKAKMTLLYTLIGAALLLGSFVIANSIKGTVDEINTSNPK